ncbi:MAG TPA: type I restriction-modification system subunit M [Candidatus Cloacimonadota bacterium]|nr:type I restriction-modification system subunit M [Candidatus Cloacimonadota bacterium]HPT70701.1 type I restriction-modification system subunit M [Candidatus Cloacimonadota bacterium]
MTPIPTKDEINEIVWQACDTFRGAIDAGQYKDYILTMLFIKYISDLWKDKYEEYSERYAGDAERIKRALERERFKVPPESDFTYLFSRKEDANIGEIINKALNKIEDANKLKLENVFRNVDFNSEAALGQTKDRNRRLRNLLNDFNNPKLDLRPSVLHSRDVIGDVYEYLIARFAAGAGKKAGEFYTPAEVSELLAKLVHPKPGDRICDPTCGSGSLLIKVAKEVKDSNYALYGQESNGSTWSLCRMNMFLHGMDSAQIEWGDTINSPRLIENDELMRFNIVVANPPFSLEKWGYEDAGHDRFNRFWRGIPPKSKGDYAFISHMIETTLKDEGRVAVIVPHGVLFRGGAEGMIRTKLVDDNLLEAVIGLPEKLFYGAGISACILIFNKARKVWDKAVEKRDKHVLFIDASKDYTPGKKQNILNQDAIRKIVQTYDDFTELAKYSHLSTLDEIKSNEYNLNIPRYVDTFEAEEEIDIKAVQESIKTLEGELETLKKEMQEYLQELGFGDES